LREFLFSDDLSDVLWEIGERNHISDEKLSIVSSLIGYVALGLIHTNELTKKVEEEAGLDERVAQSIGSEIESRILTPVLSEIHSFYKAPIKSPSTQVSGKQSSPQNDSNLLSPAFKVRKGGPADNIEQNEVKFTKPTPSVPLSQPTEPQENTKPAEPAPFVLHEEKEIEPLASGTDSPLSRPQFYKSTYSGSSEEKPTTARLEIGQEEQQEGEVVGHVGSETAKIVNYTGPTTKVDPFKRPQANDKNEVKEDKDKPVSPDNIVNLKDLPK